MACIPGNGSVDASRRFNPGAFWFCSRAYIAAEVRVQPLNARARAGREWGRAGTEGWALTPSSAHLLDRNMRANEDCDDVKIPLVVCMAGMHCLH